MTIRILFGTEGWPCGLHEVASQAVRLGLAKAYRNNVWLRLGHSSSWMCPTRLLPVDTDFGMID